MSGRGGDNDPPGWRRFVLCAPGRSGSTLLALTLDQHPQVRMCGEVFHDSEAQRLIALAGHVPPDHDPLTAPNRFLERLYDVPKAGRGAIGFKLLYAHFTRNGSAQEVPEWLARRPGILVLMLRRRNLLGSYLSLQVAHRTECWTRRPGEARVAVEPFHVEPTDCLDYFRYIDRHEARLEALFHDHDVLRIEYESDLCDGFSEALAGIWEFLGVRDLELKPPIVKQAHRPAAEQVSNYDMLVHELEGTRYAHLLSE